MVSNSDKLNTISGFSAGPIAKRKKNNQYDQQLIKFVISLDPVQNSGHRSACRFSYYQLEMNKVSENQFSLTSIFNVLFRQTDKQLAVSSRVI